VRIASTILFGSLLVSPLFAESEQKSAILSLALEQPETVAKPPALNLLPPVESLSLEHFETMALASHPGIAHAQARVSAAQCACHQAGLPPNPTVGYSGNEIGDVGKAGQQGFYVGQKFIRGNKLEWNRAVASQEVRKLQQELAARQLRVLTDVRTAYYAAYVAQQEVKLTAELTELSKQAVATADDLLTAGEGHRADLLIAEIEAARATADNRAAANRFDQAWRQLLAVSAQAHMTPAPLEADFESLTWYDSWEATLDRLLLRSPEIAAAAVEVEKRRAAICRARAEPVPDISAQVGVQYDYASEDVIASVQLVMPIPLWNRNQGGIGEAQAQLVAARRAWETTELDLTQRLAIQFQAYQTAQVRADAFRDEIVPRAQKSLELVTKSYRAGEFGYLVLLTSQRTFFRVNLEFLDALRNLNESVHLLDGLLLGGGLQLDYRGLCSE